MVPFSILASSDKTVQVKAQVPVAKKPMTLKISRTKFDEGVVAHRSGAKIQDAFPTLSDGEREYLMSGIDPETWNQWFGEE